MRGDLNDGGMVQGLIGSWAHRLPREGGTASIGAALGLLLFAFLVRLPVDKVVGGPLPPFLTVYPVLPLIGFVGGFRVGMGLSVVALFVGWALWIEPFGSLALPGWSGVMTMTFFAVAAPIVLAFGSATRLASGRLGNRATGHSRDSRETFRRTKDALAAVSAATKLEAPEAVDVSAFASRLAGRVGAMARAQDLLAGQRDGRTSLRSVVTAGVFAGFGNPRLLISEGPETHLPPGCVPGLVLALHELCVDALTHGAMADTRGQIEISWRIAGGRIDLTWVESSHSVRDDSDGFSTELIRTALNGVPRGWVEYRRVAGDVACSFIWRDGQ